MRYLEENGMWLLPAPSGDTFEILVSGDSAAPSSKLMKTMGAALKNLEELKIKSVDYLDSFVERSKFGGTDNWYFEGIESSGEKEDGEPCVRLYFTIVGDTYGEWSVYFQLSKDIFFPIKLSRKNV